MWSTLHPLYSRIRWELVIGMVLGGLIVGVVSRDIYQDRVAKMKEQKALALEQQRASLTDEFNKLKAETDELNLQSTQRIADLERRVADARRVYKAAPCIPVQQAAPAKGSRNSGSVQGGYVQYGHGVDADALISYFRLAEAIRNSQDICRQQLDKIYK